MVSKDVKAGRLPFDTALGVFESTGWVGTLADALGPYEELVRTVPEPRNSDCWMNFVNGCHEPLVTNGVGGVSLKFCDRQ
jgi:hypothetical protein